MPWTAKKGGFRKKGAKKGKGGFVKNPKQYEALRSKGFSKKSAAAITNSKKK